MRTFENEAMLYEAVIDCALGALPDHDLADWTVRTRQYNGKQLHLLHPLAQYSCIDYIHQLDIPANPDDWMFFRTGVVIYQILSGQNEHDGGITYTFGPEDDKFQWTLTSRPNELLLSETTALRYYLQHLAKLPQYETPIPESQVNRCILDPALRKWIMARTDLAPRQIDAAVLTICLQCRFLDPEILDPWNNTMLGYVLAGGYPEAKPAAPYWDKVKTLVDVTQEDNPVIEAVRKVWFEYSKTHMQSLMDQSTRKNVIIHAEPDLMDLFDDA